MRSSSRLILGSANFGMPYAGLSHHLDSQEIASIIEMAQNFGIRTVDTAEGYGLSIKNLKELLLAKDENHEIGIVNKVSAHSNDSHLDFLERLIGSLGNLSPLKVEGILLHNTASVVRDARLKEVCSNAFSIFRQLHPEVKIGYSIYDSWELDSLFATGTNFDILQLPDNVFSRKFYSSTVLNGLRESGVEVHLRSIFLQGLLVNPGSLAAKFGSLGMKYENTLDSLCHKHNVNRMTALISFFHHLPWAAGLVVGVNSATQLRDVISAFYSAANVYFPFEELPIMPKRLSDPRFWDK